MDLGERATTAANAGLANDPAAVFALSQSSVDDEDVVKLGQMYQGFQVIDQKIHDLTQLSKADQDQQWQSLDQATQELYKSHGYQPVQYEDKSILRRVTKGIGTVTGPASRLLGFNDTFKGVTDLMQGASDETTHAYRFVRETLFDGKQDSFGDAWDKWNRTANGETYYRDDVREQLKSMVPPGAEDFAIASAAGMTPSEYLKKRGLVEGSPDYQKTITTLYGAYADEKFQDAVNFLANNKISPGRDVRSLATMQVPGMGRLSSLTGGYLGGDEAVRAEIQQNTPIGGPIPVLKNIGAGDFISGSVDAYWRLKMDPTLAAGKLSKAWRVGKYGLDPNNMVNDINAARDAWSSYKAGDLSRVKAPIAYGQAAERIAHYAGEGDWDGLVREMPGIAHGLDSLKAYHDTIGGIKSADDVFDFYQDAATGMKMITTGRYATHAFPAGTGKLFLPTATVLSPVKAGVKEGIETLIDKGRFKNVATDVLKVGEDLYTPTEARNRYSQLLSTAKTLGPDDPQLTGIIDEMNLLEQAIKAGQTTTVTTPVQRAIWNPARVTGDLLHSLTVHVPKEDFMNPDSPQATEYIRQLLNYHLPKDMRAEVFNTWMESPNMATKKLVYENAMKLQATSAGMGNTVKGQAFLQRFFGRMNQAFAVGGLDRRLLPNGDQIRAGIWPDQMAGAWEYPSFRKWYNASRDIGDFHQTTQDIVDTIHSQIWKPSVLLRVGFIPRAFGEELVWGMAQFGTGAVGRGHLMAIAAKDANEPILAVRPLMRMSRTFSNFAPSILDRPVTALDSMVEAGGNMVSRWVRNQAYNMLPGEGAPIDYQAAVRHLLSHQPAAGSAFAEGFSATNEFGLAGSHNDDGLIYTFKKRDPDGGFQEVHARLDGFEEAGPSLEEPGATPVADTDWGTYRVMHHWDQYGDTDPVRNLFRSAGAQWLHPQELDAAAAKAAEFGINVGKQDLYKLVPENMPPEWDLWLNGKLDSLPDSAAAQVPSNTLAFIESLPERERYALYSRNSVLDRHIASQELGQRNLLDPHNLPDDLMQEMHDRIDETLNRELYFHGSSRLTPEGRPLTEVSYQPGNLYGPGFYTTADPNIAAEYTTKGGRVVTKEEVDNAFKSADELQAIGEIADATWMRQAANRLKQEYERGDLRPGVYKLEWLGEGNPRLLDLDLHPDAVPDDVKEVLNRHIGHDVFNRVIDEDYIDNEINRLRALGTDQAQLQDIHEGLLNSIGQRVENNSLADILEQYTSPPTGEAHIQGEVAAALHQDLQGLGYDGFTHEGGRRMGDQPHKVSIFFDPSKLGVDKFGSVRQKFADMLQRFQDAGYEGFPAVIDAARAVGVREEEIVSIVQDLQKSWMGRGYEGMLHPESGKATLWDSTGKAVRDITGTGERKLWHQYYGAMAEGNYQEGERLVTQMAHSRYMRGDMEQVLSRSDAANYMQDGTQVSTPVPQGFNRVYTITIPGTAAEAVKGFKVDPNMIDKDMAFLAMAGDQAIEFGVPGIPGQAWFTADYNQAQSVAEQMNSRFAQMTQSVEGGGRVSIGYKDIPARDFNRGRALARDQIAGGLAPTADTRQLATVYVGPEHKASIQPLPGNARELAPYGGELRPVSELRDRLDELKAAVSAEDAAPSEALQGDLPFEELHEAVMDGPGFGDPSPGNITMVEDPAMSLPSRGLSSRWYIKWSDEGEPVGLLNVNIVGSQPAGFSVAVAPEFRRQGIATSLYNELEKDGISRASIEAASGQTGYTEAGRAFNIARRNKEINQIQEALDQAALIPGVDRADTLRELAGINMQDFRNSFSNPFNHEDPRDLRSVLYSLEKNGKVSLDDWDALKHGDLPKTLTVPRLTIPKETNLYQRGTEKGFEWIGRAGNAIIRQPLFNHLYAEGLSTVAPAVRNMLIDPELDSRLTTFATKYGMKRDDLLHEWYKMPDYIKQAADPASIATLHGYELPEALANLTPGDAAKINTAVDHLKWVEQEVSDTVLERAQREVLPFLDDHRLRSQFQEKHRWLTPFQFAEEQFAKRWARTIRRQPELIRKAALTINGFKHMGIITQNEFGEDVYNIPGSEYFMAGVSRAVETLTGRPAMMPFSNPFTGQLKYSVPGLDRFGVPAAGPVIGLPVSLAERIFPELHDNPLVSGFESAVYGDRGNRRTIAQQLVPASLLTIYNSIIQKPDGDAQMSSAMTQAMAYMEASGLAPADDASDKEIQVYKDRLTNWARTMLFTRGVLQFLSPATPTSELPANFSPEFKDLLRQMPMKDAMGVFLARHPDGEPWTIFDTKSVSGAPLPATDEAFSVMTNNEDFFKTYQNGAFWFLPQSDSTDPFDRQAYYYQLSHGYRVRKSTDEIWKDMKFAEASDVYFKSQDAKNAALENAANNTQLKNQIKADWSNWKDDYFKAHPVFATELNNPDAHTRRAKTLSQLTDIFASGNYPETPQTPYLKDMVSSYNQVISTLDSWKGDNSKRARDTKNALREHFNLWGTDYTTQHPEVKSFWDRVIRPELKLEDLTEED